MKKLKLIPIVTATAVATVAVPLTTLTSCNKSPTQQTTIQIEVENPTNASYTPVNKQLLIQPNAPAVFDIVCNDADLPFFMGTTEIVGADANGNKLLNLIFLKDFIFQRIKSDTNSNDASLGNRIRIIVREEAIRKAITIKVLKFIVKVLHVKIVPIKFVGAVDGMTCPTLPTQIPKDRDLEIKGLGYDTAAFNHLLFRDGDDTLDIYPGEIIVTPNQQNVNLIDLTIKKTVISRIKNGLLCIVEPWSVNPHDTNNDIDAEHEIQLDNASSEMFELVDDSDHKGTYRNGYTGILKLKEGAAAGRAIQAKLSETVLVNGSKTLIPDLDFSIVELSPQEIVLHIPPHVIGSNVEISANTVNKDVTTKVSFLEKNIYNGQIKDLIHVSPYGAFEPGKEFQMLIWPTIKAMFLHKITATDSNQQINIDVQGYKNDDNPLDPSAISLQPKLDNMAILVTLPSTVTQAFENQDELNLLLYPKNFI